MTKIDHVAFHESYFEHPCSVMTERDVLDTDIRGNSWQAALRRWFHSWFLLSYYDERCRVYYTSSHALRLERARHFRKYRGRIHPLSKFSNLWTTTICVMLVVNRIVFHHNTEMYYGKQSPTTITIGIVLETIMLFDLIVNFKTGFTDEVARKVILDATMGYVHYTSTKLFLHLASVLPLQFIMWLRYGVRRCILCRASTFVCVIRMLGIFGLLRIYDATAFLGRNRTSFKKTYYCKFFRILLLAFLTSNQYLKFLDSVNMLLVIQTQKLPNDSYMIIILHARRFLYDKDFKYCVSVDISKIAKSLLLFGYGMNKNDYYLDKVFSLLCYAISCVFYNWALLECYAIIQRNKYVNEEITVISHQTTNWLRSNQLSEMIYSKVHHYYDFNLTRLKVMEKNNSLYKSLPSTLTKEIKLCSYFSYLRRIPYFAEWPFDVLEELIILLKREIYLQRDIVAHPFAQGEGLIIVFAGILAVYNVAQEEIGHLIDGDYFGELSLVTDEEIRTSTVTAVTTSQVLILSKGVFRKCMTKYSSLFYQLRAVLLKKYIEMQSTSELALPKDENR